MDPLALFLLIKENCAGDSTLANSAIPAEPVLEIVQRFMLQQVET
jgi:hypothetical protein